MENQKPDEKGSILFKEIGFLGIVLTALLYMSAYACEVITAFYFGFDVDLISLPMSVVIKNNIIILFIIAISLLPVIVGYFANEIGKKNNETGKKNNKNSKNFKIILGIIILGIIILGIWGVYYFFYLQKDNKHYLIAVIIFVFTMFFAHKIVFSKTFIQLLSFLPAFFVFYFALVTLLFYFTLQDFKPEYSFEYNKQDYILLRNYDGNLVANKIGQEPDKYCFNKEILYLPKDILKEGLTFKKINNVVADCEKLNALKLAAIKIVRKQDCEGYKVITIETERKQAIQQTNLLKSNLVR